MRTSSAKAKGRRCASETREKLMEYAPDLRPDDIVVTSSGATGEDLGLSPAARQIYPLTFECKNVERVNIWEALKQAEAHQKKRPDTYPVVSFKRNRSELYVALRLEHFLKLIR